LTDSANAIIRKKRFGCLKVISLRLIVRKTISMLKDIFVCGEA